MHRYPFIVDIPADEYHEAARRGEFLSSHLLGDFRACPRLYRKKMSGEIEPTDTAAYQTGRAFLAISLGALPASDRDYYEAVMGDAAIRSLPYFDPTRGVKKTTFVIECVENYLINESIASNQLKRKAVLVPITNEDIQAAREQGLAAEEELVAGRRHSFNDILLEMDFRQFLSSLTPLERLLLDYRLHDLTFAEIAELRGMPVTTWKRREWKSVQDKAVKFGGLEPHGKPDDDGTECGERAR